MQSLYPNSVPKPQKQKPPRKVRASADARGERYDILHPWGSNFASKAKLPLLSLEESRETFLARKVSRAAFLWYLSFAEAKESTRKIPHKRINPTSPPQHPQKSTFSHIISKYSIPSLTSAKKYDRIYCKIFFVQMKRGV
jgi:hypothetical protein